MIFATVNKIPGFILDKLGLLFKLLKERKKEYELFADKLKDKQLRRTVLSLAQETNQYAVELSGQIQIMGGKPGAAEEDGNGMESLLQIIPEENDILASCEVSEKKMIVAYREILNEPFLHENLRKLIRCQLNGLTYAFMQIKLLKTSFHR
ncbi:MAG: DUF2383 domain-containing protein [Bacteroidota bacterium]|nr:DUF2383 domain-containing protein [Bacteroidota bacterium]